MVWYDASKKSPPYYRNVLFLTKEDVAKHGLAGYGYFAEDERWYIVPGSYAIPNKCVELWAFRPAFDKEGDTVVR